MNAPAQAFRITAATGLHRGDRAYQQDQVALLTHARVPGCALGVVADGMGGKSGGRKAADQVMLTAQQLFERYAYEAGVATVPQIPADARLVQFVETQLVDPTLRCAIAHAGDSRVYHFHGPELVSRTIDHSFVQRLVDEGRLTEDEALTHPQGNLLTGCLGTHQDPPLCTAQIDRLAFGDTLLACSDGLWHYFTARELGAIVHALPPREASEKLVNKARQRARSGGDNLSLAILRIDALG